MVEIWSLSGERGILTQSRPRNVFEFSSVHVPFQLGSQDETSMRCLWREEDPVMTELLGACHAGTLESLVGCGIGDASIFSRLSGVIRSPGPLGANSRRHRLTMRGQRATCRVVPWAHNRVGRYLKDFPPERISTWGFPWPIPGLRFKEHLTKFCCEYRNDEGPGNGMREQGPLRHKGRLKCQLAALAQDSRGFLFTSSLPCIVCVSRRTCHEGS